jgi:hypothetical protein
MAAFQSEVSGNQNLAAFRRAKYRAVVANAQPECGTSTLPRGHSAGTDAFNQFQFAHPSLHSDAKHKPQSAFCSALDPVRRRRNDVTADKNPYPTALAAESPVWIAFPAGDC